MQEAVAKLFQKFVEKLPASPDASLRVEKVQSADEASAAPCYTVLIHGRHEGSDDPLAVVLVTVPSRAADDTALLEFVVRRARAHKIKLSLVVADEASHGVQIGGGFLRRLAAGVQGVIQILT